MGQRKGTIPMEAKQKMSEISQKAMDDAAEVAALCETVAQYILRLEEKARGTWAAMAMEDLADAAIDIKTRAKELIQTEEELINE
jgi:inhibitor of KinA sporulation pathway (predicted exonuclease)